MYKTIRAACINSKKNLSKTPKARLNDESAQPDVQFVLLTVVRADQRILTVNTIKHATHDVIRNTL